TATDSHGAMARFAFQLTVHNVAPQIVSLVSSSTDAMHVRRGAPVTITTTFGDAGVLDTHAASINWGDGQTTAGLINETSGQGTATGTHSYTAGGIYTVTVTLSDDDGRVSSQFTTTVIAGVGL